MVTENVTETSQVLNIDTTEIILIDYNSGKGKIIITDDEKYINTSYYWGSMSEGISEFIMSLSSDYFINKLGVSNCDEINMKATMRSVRRFIKSDCPLRWYQDLDYNKDLRLALRSIENSCDNKYDFVHRMQELKNRCDPFFCEYRSEAKDTIEMLSSEPCHFIVYGTARENKFLAQLFPKLKAKIKSLSVAKGLPK